LKKIDCIAEWKGFANCQRCRVRELALFADLTDEDFKLIHLPIDLHHFPAGTPIYHMGGDPTSLYTVHSGLVKLVRYLPGGSQRIVRLLRRGDTAGLEVVLGQPYAHTAIALQPVLACRIQQSIIRRLAEETPRIHQQLMQRWQEAVHRADDFLADLSTGSARARVARLFLTMRDGQTADECDFLAREDVGAMLGITTETASRMVAEMKRQGVVMELAPNRFRCVVPALEELAQEA